MKREDYKQLHIRSWILLGDHGITPIYAKAIRAIKPPTNATAGLFAVAAPVYCGGADVAADPGGGEGTRVVGVGLTGA
jgi:hypothetical protein